MRGIGSLLPRRRTAAPAPWTPRFLPAPPTGLLAPPPGRTATATMPAHAARTREHPYPCATAADIAAAQTAAYRFATLEHPAPGPAYYPAEGTAPDTRPIPVVSDLPHRIPASVAVPAVVADWRKLRWTLDALKAWDGTVPAVGLAPLHDALAAEWQPPQGPQPTGGEHLAGRITDLADHYPSPRSCNSAYTEVMDWVSVITGTTGYAPSQWPQPAIGYAP